MATNWLSEEILSEHIIKLDENTKYSADNFFSSAKTLKLDIGCGNGHFLVDTAKEESHSFFIGIELKFGRVCKSISKLVKRNIPNVKFYHGDAKFFLSCLQPSTVSEIYYNFPDPWPKRRHHKKRLFTPEFLDLLDKVMVEDGIFTCATDHPDYLNWMQHFLLKDERFVNVFKENVVNEIHGYQSTLFESIWREMGKQIFYFRFKKKNE